VYYDEAEKLSRPEIERLQLERLRKSLARAAKSPFYSALFREHDVRPDAVRTMDDVRRLPFPPTGSARGYRTSCCHAAVRHGAHARFLRHHRLPTVIYHTRNDLEWWSSLMARCMYMVGLRKDDVFQNMSGYGLFTGGLGIHCGAEKLGCLTIPAGAGNSQRQIKLLTDFKVTGIHIIPSYAMHLANIIREMGLDPRSLPVRIALVGAEPYTEGQTPARGHLRHEGLQLLRTFGDERPGSGLRMPGTKRHAPVGGRLHRRDRGPRDRGTTA
jgi:phenylacetate-CoA ligase